MPADRIVSCVLQSACYRFANHPRSTATTRAPSCCTCAVTAHTRVAAESTTIAAAMLSDANGPSESALREYLRGRLPGEDAPVLLEPIAGGQSNPTFRLRRGDSTYVLRKQPEGELLPSAHAVDRE